ncbi:protein JINGUBANG-like [Punica granatum]|uniref:Uncharacterized protein n=2 Tax=Punica granatum TaxID=22663 RepID=A0A218WZC2_PUNGR|nr:protein JINGUBANG-like [Punica granatum]OWM78127.1 hypothetical protein CDL15_Pgr014946 [Punica granatum]PKI45549.1 hypothetical protein CRG98_034067 [Punica granatum]
MEFREKVTLWSFFDEEKKSMNNTTTSPGRVSFTRSPEHDQSQSVSGQTSPTSTPVRPMSPETPWTLSPVRMSPSQPLLYHCLASLHRHKGSILSVAVSKNFIFTGTQSRRIYAWKQPKCTDAGRIIASSGEIRALLAHGRVLFTAHGDCRVRAWGVTAMDNFQPRKLATIPQRNSLLMLPRKSPNQHKDCISCLAYNHDDKLLYTGSWDRTVKAWNLTDKRCEDSFVAHEGHITGIIINQDDGRVFTCSTDGSVKIWRRVFGESSHILTMTLKFQLSPVNALALSSSPSSCILYSGSSDGLINFWEKEKTSGRFNHGGFLQGHHFAVLCLTAVADLVFSGSEDTRIRVWRREEGNNLHSCLAVMEGHQGPVRCLAATLERESLGKGLLVYSASLDETFKVWRVNIYPTEKVSLQKQKSIVDDPKAAAVDFEMSPVLSPSWVVKKLQV